MEEKEKKHYQKFTNKNQTISVKCSRKQKMKFDEIVEATRKSKTDHILDMIEEKYRELFLNK